MRAARQYAARLAEVVRLHVAASDTSLVDLVVVLGLPPSIVSRRLAGAEPWDVIDIDPLAGMFGMDAAALLREVEGRRV